MGRPVRDRTGETYGRLTAVRMVAQTLRKEAVWECRCECGNEVQVVGGKLTTGGTRSCGCLRDDTQSGVVPTPLHSRFWPKVKVGRGCWLWKGAINPSGHGRIGLGGRDDGAEYAHRVAYLLTEGPLPEGKVLHHTCENPLCVRPDHLEPVTRAEHMEIHDIRAGGR